MSTAAEEIVQITRARAGDRAAFDGLAQTNLRRLRGVVRKMIGHPEDTDEVVQESLLRAWEAVGRFRGDAGFGTWLCAIGVRCAIDHLRRQKRWRKEAQVVYGNECYTTEALYAEVGNALTAPDHVFEAHEHIAYCFTCVARSLLPEQHAALVLREVMGLSNREAAEALGVSESVLRHHLSDARATMQKNFEGLCTLVNKQGICYQCKGLRDGTPEAQRGPEIPDVADLDRRFAVVREADTDAGLSQAMHDLFWRRIKEIEEQGIGSPVPLSNCGRDE